MAGGIEPRLAVLVLLALLFVVTCAALPQYLKIRKSPQWPTVQGVITASEVLFHRGRFQGYTGNIRYRYRVGDTEYLGTRLSFEAVHLGTQEGWRHVLASYPVGKAVTVYYDPSHPDVGVLEPGLVGELSLLLKLVFILMGTFAEFFFLLFLDYRRQRLVDSGPGL
jgi:hypothetical protein